MEGISYSIRNPNSKPKPNQAIIYYDKPAASSLDVILTQDLGIPSIDPDNQIKIHFPDSLLAAAQPENLASSDWEVQHLAPPTAANNQQYVFTLHPKRSLPFGEKSLTINFQNLAGKSQTNADIYLEANLGAPVPISIPFKKLSVMAYPDQPKNLQNSISPSVSVNIEQQSVEDNLLYISPVDLQPIIENRISLNIKYQNPGPLVDKWSVMKQPFFKISFAYGAGPTDLTDTLVPGQPGYNPITTAYFINAQVGDASLWQMEQYTGVSIWTVNPTPANRHLFTETDNNLDIHFSHVISTLPGPETSIFIQWGNIPGYNDGWETRNIQKASQPKAKIISFTGPNKDLIEQVKYGEGIRLNWEVFAAPKVQLSCSENPNLSHIFDVPTTKQIAPALVYCGGISPDGSSSGNCNDVNKLLIVPTHLNSSFYLQGLDSEGKPITDQMPAVAVEVTDIPPPEVSITAAQLVGDTLSLSWQTTSKAFPEITNFSYSLTDGLGQIMKTGPTTIKGQISLQINAEQPFAPPYTLSVKSRNSSGSTQVVINAHWKSEKLIDFGKLSYPAYIALSPDHDSAFLYGSQLYQFPLKSLPNTVTKGIPILDEGVSISQFQQMAMTKDGKQQFFAQVYEGMTPIENTPLVHIDYSGDQPKVTKINIGQNVYMMGPIVLSSDDQRLFFATRGSVGYFDLKDLPAPKIQYIESPADAYFMTTLKDKIVLTQADKYLWYFDPETPPAEISDHLSFPEANWVGRPLYLAQLQRFFLNIANSPSSGSVVYYQGDQLNETPGTLVELPFSAMFHSMSISGKMGCVTSEDGTKKEIYFYNTAHEDGGLQTLSTPEPPFNILMHPLGHLAFACLHEEGKLQVFVPELLVSD